MDGFLSVDIGTSFSKGMLLSEYGSIIAQLDIPRAYKRTQGFIHENDADTDWWLSFVDITKNLLHRKKDVDVIGVTVTGMWPNLVLTDSNHHPIFPAILYDDPRSDDICRELGPILGAKTYGYEIIPRLLWFKRKHPEVLAKARSFFTTHSYVVLKLTGSPSIDSHTAISLGSVFDSLTFRWKDDIIHEFEISPDLFPPVFPPNKLVGYVTPEASDVSGLTRGIPVFAGFGDTFASLVGSGASDSGDVFLYAGSTGILLSLTHSIEFICNGTSFVNEDEGINWIMSLPRSGEKFHNIADLLCRSTHDEKQNEYDELERQASIQPPGSGGVKIFHEVGTHPFSVFGAESESAILGLHIDSSRGQLYRAGLEAFAFTIRHALESSSERGPISITGGLARSKLLRQILADTLGRMIRCSEASQGSLGGALLAAYGAGAVNLEEQSKLIQSRALSSEPGGRDVRQNYDTLYRDYVMFQEKLRQL